MTQDQEKEKESQKSTQELFDAMEEKFHDWNLIAVILGYEAARFLEKEENK